ncbi:MAG: hypothetical protein WAT71_04790 [Ignavibacteria bacterium]
MFTNLVNFKVFEISDFLNDIKNQLYIGLLLALFIITIIIDYKLLPEAQRKTRCDFFDNAFGTKFIHNKNSEEYYTNDNIEKGIYKMAVDLFESSLFTYNISSRMRFKRIILCCLLFVVLIPLSFYGFKNTFFIGIIILQALLSIYFAGGLIKLLIFVGKNKEYFEELKSLFSNSNFKQNIIEYEAKIIKLYADYESTKAWSFIHLDSRIYNKINPTLSKEWEEMKQKYNI